MIKYTVKTTDTINQAIEKISLNGVRTVFVIDEKKSNLVGVISEGDIIRALVYKKKLESNVSSIMNKSFLFLKKYDDKDAKKIFIQHQVCAIPVIDKNMKLLKVLTLEEFLKKI